MYTNATIAMLQPDELLEILFDIVPSKVHIDVEDAETVILEVWAFYQYLKRKHNYHRWMAAFEYSMIWPPVRSKKRWPTMIISA